jgi:hypothetical protein
MSLPAGVAKAALLGLTTLPASVADALSQCVVQVGLGLKQSLLLAVHAGGASAATTKESANDLSSADNT